MGTQAVEDLSKVEAARIVVDERPEDPQAHQQLAEAYLAEGNRPEALEEYHKAADLYFHQGQSIEGVKTLCDTIELQGGFSRAEENWIDELTRVLFMSAESPDFDVMFDVVKQRACLGRSMQILQARRLLILGEYPNSKTILEDFLGEDEKNELARTVMAELFFMTGKNEDALEWVNELMVNTLLPEWLVRHLNWLQKQSCIFRWMELTLIWSRRQKIFVDCPIGSGATI